jgi:hypothetical protein
MVRNITLRINSADSAHKTEECTLVVSTHSVPPFTCCTHALCWLLDAFALPVALCKTSGDALQAHSFAIPATSYLTELNSELSSLVMRRLM